ncbi:MAG TPA: PEP-CTERM sorting domain-containing protein [Syntrophobacteraceae bacterium]|nr:PEP-CTERM sorting domain-containing protein [Syntrophobacteraceae bacterium]
MNFEARFPFFRVGIVYTFGDTGSFRAYDVHLGFHNKNKGIDPLSKWNAKSARLLLRLESEFDPAARRERVFYLQGGMKRARFALRFYRVRNLQDIWIRERKETMKKSLVYLAMSAAMLLVGAVPSFAGGPVPGVPEPSTMMLVGAGVAGLVVYRAIKGRRK